MAGNALLLLVFGIGLVRPHATLSLPVAGGTVVPLAALLFALFQALYWAGNGVMSPLASSMIADVSEINKHRTGVLKDGSYSAVFSFFSKAALSVGLLITGGLLDWAGIVPEAAVQAAAATKKVALATFLTGPVIALAALLLILAYPVDRKYMMKIKADLAAREVQ